jgi:hypothetical protein
MFPCGKKGEERIEISLGLLVVLVIHVLWESVERIKFNSGQGIASAGGRNYRLHHVEKSALAARNMNISQHCRKVSK